jgi:hypothetical protein
MLQELENALSRQGFCFFRPVDDYVTFLNPDKQMMTLQKQWSAYWLFLGNKPASSQLLRGSNDLQELIDFLLVD